MSKELLRPAVTTESTYTDIGADTPEGFSISSRSRSLAREAVGNSTPEDRIRQRCSIAVGDWAMADLLRFSHDPVAAGLAALDAGAPIFTDIRMVLTRSVGTLVQFPVLLILVRIFPEIRVLPGVQQGS